ncbi:MAG: riboflavin synthase [Thermoplasmata archaeon]
MKIVGIADTTFARYDMGKSAIDQLKSMSPEIKTVRYTVPGIKDLPAAARILFDKYHAEMVMALGMPGAKEIDKISAHEAATGLITVQAILGKHILIVFVYEDEAKDESQLAWLADRRTREHAVNAYYLLFDQEFLQKNAGKGLRQGYGDVGPLR